MQWLEQMNFSRARLGIAQGSSFGGLPQLTPNPGPETMQVQDSQPTRIYLVDEELIVLKTLQGFLSDLGYKVRSFFSAGELMAYPKNEVQPVNVIVMDLNLPEEDSVKVIRDLHQRYPETDIVIMTGHSPLLPVTEALSNGVYGYLTKPIRLGELELMLIRLTESRSQAKSQLLNGSRPADHNDLSIKD